MPDSRRHRGPHPQDAQLFAPSAVETLRAAVSDLSWLRNRGYAEASAIKLVGDRYQLRARQRIAVGRCACAKQAFEDRQRRRIEPSAVEDQLMLVDGLNVLTTLEVALAGGVLLLGRDGCLRDMASFHGNYRLVHETERAVQILLGQLDSLKPQRVTLHIDRPVSNSGRLAQMIRDKSAASRTPIETLVSDRVDETLKSAESGIVATADSAILDACGPWLNLARLAVEEHRKELPDLWLLDLASSGP